MSSAAATTTTTNAALPQPPSLSSSECRFVPIASSPLFPSGALSQSVGGETTTTTTTTTSCSSPLVRTTGMTPFVSDLTVSGGGGSSSSNTNTSTTFALTHPSINSSVSGGGNSVLYTSLSLPPSVSQVDNTKKSVHVVRGVVGGKGFTPSSSSSLIVGAQNYVHHPPHHPHQSASSLALVGSKRVRDDNDSLASSVSPLLRPPTTSTPVMAATTSTSPAIISTTPIISTSSSSSSSFFDLEVPSFLSPVVVTAEEKGKQGEVWNSPSSSSSFFSSSSSSSSSGAGAIPLLPVHFPPDRETTSTIRRASPVLPPSVLTNNAPVTVRPRPLVPESAARRRR